MEETVTSFLHKRDRKVRRVIRKTNHQSAESKNLLVKRVLRGHL